MPEVNWKIVGVADYNGDTKPDLLWRNSVSGENVVWWMNGVVRTGAAALLTVADVAWRVATGSE